MQVAQGIRPTLPAEPAEGLPHLDSKQRIVDPSLGLVDVALGRNHVVVPSQHDRGGALGMLGRMRDQPLEPAQLVVELGTGVGVAVG